MLEVPVCKVFLSMVNFLHVDASFIARLWTFSIISLSLLAEGRQYWGGIF